MSVSAQNGEFAIAPQYGMYEEGYTSSRQASGLATFTANPADADTLTIASRVYRFKTTPAALNDVKIGTTVYDTLANLVTAVKATPSGSGVTFYAGTKPLLPAYVETTGLYIVVYAFLPGQAGNALTLAKSSAVISVSGTTLSGGLNGGKALSGQGRIGFTAIPTEDDTITVNAIVYTFKATPASGVQIQIAASLADTLADAVLTINANDPLVLVEAEDAILDIKAVATGTGGNAYTLADSATTTDVSGATLSGGQAASAFNENALLWRRFRVTDLDYDVVQMQSTIDPEIGRVITPTGAYKGGVAVGGGVSMMPRGYDTFGWLLFAALGGAATTNPSSGVGRHVFAFRSDNEAEQPWIAARKAVPNRDKFQGRGIIGFDNKVGMLRIAVNAARPIEARVELEGRFPKQDRHPELWTAQNGFEDFTTGLLACQGHFQLPTLDDLPVPLSVSQVVVELGNQITGPREEMVVGSKYMSDIITRLRGATVRFAYLWNGPEINDYLFAGGVGETEWSPTPFRTTKSGSNWGFSLLSESEGVIPGTTTPYSLEIRGNDIFWQAGSPTRLRGGDIVMIEVVGTLLAPASSAYIEYILTNGNTSGYTWPTES